MSCIPNGNSSSQANLSQKEDLEDESDSSDDALHSHWSVQHDVHTLSFEDNSSNSKHTETSYIGHAKENEYPEVLAIDSACSHHMFNLSPECFTVLKACRVVIATGNGKITATGRGKLRLMWPTADGDSQMIILNDVLRITNLPVNLLSVGQLCDMGVSIEFSKDEASIELPEPSYCSFSAERHNGLYQMNFKALDKPDTATSLLANSSSKDMVYKVHNLLNHMPLRKMKEQIKEGVFDSMLSRKEIRAVLDFSLDEFTCDACQKSKERLMKTNPKKAPTKVREPGEIIVSDCSGPFAGLPNQYYILVMDLCTKFTHVTWIASPTAERTLEIVTVSLHLLTIYMADTHLHFAVTVEATSQPRFLQMP